MHTFIEMIHAWAAQSLRPSKQLNIHEVLSPRNYSPVEINEYRRTWSVPGQLFLLFISFRQTPPSIQYRIYL